MFGFPVGCGPNCGSAFQRAKKLFLVVFFMIRRASAMNEWAAINLAECHSTVHGFEGMVCFSNITVGMSFALLLLVLKIAESFQNCSTNFRPVSRAISTIDLAKSASVVSMD